MTARAEFTEACVTFDVFRKPFRTMCGKETKLLEHVRNRMTTDTGPYITGLRSQDGSKFRDTLFCVSFLGKNEARVASGLFIFFCLHWAGVIVGMTHPSV